ncbi:hypothetical protein NLU13_3937 [Sarocladium strictum]|uniref:Uncharacterized protein n=1 Tax=Sarocladium strictum TaxID=5046 RepID=A0AA39L865_SARSR|nr:hypothetical protein NLU13_3937 [Sarocladium strictum]
MVTLKHVQASNSRVAQSLPAGLVAVFAGATSGIGELALKSFAKYTNRPKIYFIGRSQGADTSEGLRYLMAVTYYSRMRMALNLLPLLEAAHSIRRVVSPQCAGFEGTLYLDHIADGKVPLRDARPHLATLVTLGLEALARRSPTVSFIHNFPGAVKTNLIRPEDGIVMRMMNLWFQFTLRNKWVPFEEVGERHAWLCLSEQYPGKEARGSEGGVILDGSDVARGIDGVKGSGVYSIDAEGESTGEDIVEILRKYREDGSVDSVWKDLDSQFKRITGSVSA